MPTLNSPTDAKIRALKPQDKPVKWLLGNNLYVFVLPSGGKTYRWNYIFFGKHKTLTLGSCKALTLLDARLKRAQAAQNVVDGIDPSAEKQKNKALAVIEAENTFFNVATKWHRHWIKTKAISENHAKKTWGRLSKDVLPRLGPMPIKAITRAQIVELAQAPVNRGSLDIASRVLDTVAAVFDYALNTGLISTDPASGMKTSSFIPTTKVEHMPRIKPHQIPEFFYRLENDKMNPQIRLFLLIMARVFTRKNELLGAKWSEFDFDAAVWHVDWERMKDRQPHEVPLAKQTIDLLQQLKDLKLSTTLLFPAASRKSETGFLSDSAIRNQINKMGFKPVSVVVNGKSESQGMSIHGFRGLASTALSETTEPASPSIVQFTDMSANSNKSLGKNLIVETQLGHRLGDGSSSPYNHAKHWSFRVTMMQEWADWLDEQPGKYVP